MRSTKLGLFLLVIAVVAAPLCLAFSDDWTHAYAAPNYDFTTNNEDSRRLLFQYGFAYKYPKNKYLGYDALRKNNSPCRHRGRSYYDCKKRRKANPYRRGCIAITGCARFTD
ncbi:hypothetical protein IC575_019145 [Cucumis melo]